MANALVTLASMFKLDEDMEIVLIKIEIHKDSAY